MFNSWPGWYQVLWGATWGNNDAALEWLIILGVLSFVFRRFLKKIFSGFGVKIRNLMSEHIGGLLKDHLSVINDTLEDHHQKIKTLIREGQHEEDNARS